MSHLKVGSRPRCKFGTSFFHISSTQIEQLMPNPEEPSTKVFGKQMTTARAGSINPRLNSNQYTKQTDFGTFVFTICSKQVRSLSDLNWKFIET